MCDRSTRVNVCGIAARVSEQTCVCVRVCSAKQDRKERDERKRKRDERAEKLAARSGGGASASASAGGGGSQRSSAGERERDRERLEARDLESACYIRSGWLNHDTQRPS